MADGETPDLAGRVVLITGASRGLGRALAGAFARAGARLVLCARGAAALEEAARELRAAGAEVLARPADVADEEAVASLVAAAEARWGAVHTVVNNASLLGSRVPLASYEPGEWRRVLDANVTGPFLVARAVLPGMRRTGGGSIINVTSGVGNQPRARWGAYAVSKWAIEALTWNLAIEEEPNGVRVNAVDPGRLRTAMRRAAYPEEDPAAPAPPEEATPVFLWLASDAARGVTGRRFQALSWP